MKAKNMPLGIPFRYSDYKKAQDALCRSLKTSGYALLLGESGTGKTTLLRDLETNLDKSRYSVLYLCHGRPSPSALARVLAEALHLPLRRTRAEMSRLLMHHLSTLPTRLLLWIDETQLISADTLHEIRLLAEANLQGPPLFSVLLSALPELKERLLAPDLFPLWRRISVYATLAGLRREEVEPFLDHVLSERERKAFAPEALTVLFEHSRGIPAVLKKYAALCLLHRTEGKGPIVADQIPQLLENSDTF